MLPVLKFEDFAGLGGSRVAPWSCPIEHPMNVLGNSSGDSEFDGIFRFGDVAETGLIGKSPEMIRNTLSCRLTIHLYRYSISNRPQGGWPPLRIPV